MSVIKSAALAVAMTFAISLPALAQPAEPSAGSIDCAKAFFQCYYLDGRDFISCSLELRKCLASDSPVALPPSRDR
ncbi:hypothetical protein [Stenotrophomonas sp. CFBP 13725]|uniref:hypothetical protein n=1 Tax=Stenotrophomonas sp. CFBP 13725 TaxID=2775297 RepID=UPI00177D952D|nr:hypothetical protein [Stenotrophomonas sp. CFBP 13725]MBD8634967.1 hypothetical protein [Stenotrophomonas sp. CFBP 13725]